jgi:hypothetical protein
MDGMDKLTPRKHYKVHTVHTVHTPLLSRPLLSNRYIGVGAYARARGNREGVGHVFGVDGMDVLGVSLMISYF